MDNILYKIYKGYNYTNFDVPLTNLFLMVMCILGKLYLKDEDLFLIFLNQLFLFYSYPKLWDSYQNRTIFFK